MQKMVAGFLLNHQATQVALVLKKRPKWQAGNYNAIGGKIEAGETSLEAMHREFREETGVLIDTWIHFETIGGEDWQVDFYWSNSDLEGLQFEFEDEPIHVFALDELPTNVLPNVPGLLQQAVVAMKGALLCV